MTIPAEHLGAIARRQRTGADPAVVVFLDLDRTLIAGYSIVALALEAARHGANRGDLRQAFGLLRAAWRHRRTHSGTNYHRLVRQLSNALRGVSEATLVELGETAYHHTIARSLYSEAIGLVEAHRQAGHHLVILSAASRYQIEPVAQTLGIDDICCTRLEVQDGRFTGRVITPLCYGEGKALAARRIAKRLGTTLADCWFYTDSSADLPLLSQVGMPVAVNASSRLTDYASRRGWTRLAFSSRGRPELETIARTVFTAQTVAAATALGFAADRLRLDRRLTSNLQTRLLGDVGRGLSGLNFEIEGGHSLSAARPAVFIFNHQSLLDAIVIAHLLRRDAVGFCKQEAANAPLLGRLLRQMDTVFVDRESGDQAGTLKRALAILEEGRSLVIAPEGTRSTLGDLQPFRHGAFWLAKKAGVPIIPLVLHNMKDALPKGGLLIRPATVKVSVLPPIEPGSIRKVKRTCADTEQQYTHLLTHSEKAALPYPARALASA